MCIFNICHELPISLTFFHVSCLLVFTVPFLCFTSIEVLSIDLIWGGIAAIFPGVFSLSIFKALFFRSCFLFFQLRQFSFFIIHSSFLFPWCFFLHNFFPHSPYFCISLFFLLMSQVVLNLFASSHRYTFFALVFASPSNFMNLASKFFYIYYHIV